MLFANETAIICNLSSIRWVKMVKDILWLLISSIENLWTTHDFSLHQGHWVQVYRLGFSGSTKKKKREKNISFGSILPPYLNLSIFLIFWLFYSINKICSFKTPSLRDICFLNLNLLCWDFFFFCLASIWTTTHHAFKYYYPQCIVVDSNSVVKSTHHFRC